MKKLPCQDVKIDSLLYWQLATIVIFGLITEKLSVRNFILTGPGTMHLL